MRVYPTFFRLAFSWMDAERAHKIGFKAIRLAHSLGMKVVAEGVESSEVLAAVTDLGADLVQGFHLHRPCGSDEFASAQLQERPVG